MPTLFRLFGYRFFYRLYDLINEPCHVHVGDDGRKLCKFWVCLDDTIELADSVGFTRRELNRIEKAIVGQLIVIKDLYEADCLHYDVPPNYKYPQP
jgi:hypothetical protein